jgi:hypothetical protein
MPRTSSGSKAKVIRFPRPKTEAERLAQEEQRRRNESIARLIEYADKLDW